MHDPYTSYSEAYEVVKTAIVVHEKRYFKIEVLQDMQKPDLNEFSTRVYVETSIKATPSYSDDVLSQQVRAWSRLVDFPWVKRDTPEGAMSQALGFLQERYKR